MPRFREALVKSVPVIGGARPSEAIMEVDAAIRPEDKDTNLSCVTWKIDEVDY